MQLSSVFWLAAVSSASTRRQEQPVGISCSDIPQPEVLGATVASFAAVERRNVSGLVLRQSVLEFDLVTGLNICNVNISLRHPEARDTVDFEIWLPLQGWNGRFKGVGGGKWLAGYPGTRGLGLAVQEGYAAAITTGGNVSDSEGFVHDDMVSGTGVVDLGRVSMFASCALHDLAVLGKAVATSFYGEAPHHSYWDGCSQGGRQGYMLAQRYPDDFQGIFANAPAIQWGGLFVTFAWGQFVQRWKAHAPPACVWSAFTDASTAACDELDGVLDGVISDYSACLFDPDGMVGTSIDCDGQPVVISDKDADVVGSFHKGPLTAQGTRLFPSYPWGIDYTALVLAEPPNDRLWNDWIRIFLKKHHDFNVSTVTTLDQFNELFALSTSEYGGIIGTDVPDLSAFRDKGHRLLTYHGTADTYIPVDATLQYRKNVEGFMGGNERVNDFYRVFLAPGIAHCGNGTGAYPADAFGALVDWVEKGLAPDTLRGTMSTADGVDASRIMCPWPLISCYDGGGDTNDASNFYCASSCETLEDL